MKTSFLEGVPVHGRCPLSLCAQRPCGWTGLPAPPTPPPPHPRDALSLALFAAESGGQFSGSLCPIVSADNAFPFSFSPFSFLLCCGITVATEREYEVL